MVRKEDIVNVLVDWREGKPARLNPQGPKPCPRGIKDPRNCEICAWFAGYYDEASRNIDFMQRWLGTGQRRVAYVQCGAPADVRAAAKTPVDEGHVVGMSPDHPDFDKTLQAKVGSEKPVVESVPPEPPEPEEAVL